MATKLTTRQRDKLIEAAQNAVEFTVAGSGEFPHDMLRYDHCWPATQSDASQLNSRFARQITLRGLTGPTAARWFSFGWHLMDP